MRRAYPALRTTLDGRARTLCCHGATLSGRWPANSLEAVEECIAAGVPRLELDVRFLADDSMLIFHDEHLDTLTTGHGRVSTLVRADIDGLEYTTSEPTRLCFLEEVVERLKGSGPMLQVDLKLMRPITDERSRRLIAALAPLDGNLVVGSQAHWNLRRLSQLPIAFDPTLHWHYAPKRSPEAVPRTLGVHGLWDDSPLASNPHVAEADYLESRVRDLLGLAPGVVEWMVDIPTLLHLGRLGLALGERLRAEGCSLAAWTLRADWPDRRQVLARLFELGVETVITDAPILVAADLPATRCVNPL